MANFASIDKLACRAREGENAIAFLFPSMLLNLVVCLIIKLPPRTICGPFYYFFYKKNCQRLTLSFLVAGCGGDGGDGGDEFSSLNGAN